MKKRILYDELKGKFKDDMTLMVGGFMTCGTPKDIIDAIFDSGVKNLTIICNDAGLEGEGVGKLIKNGQVKKLIASHIGLNPEAGSKMSNEEMEVELIPQGTLAEKIRSGGVGLGGFLTPTGLGTMVQEGKEVIVIGEKEYLLETPLKADMALIYGSQVDTKGNIVYRKTKRNFNPLMAMAADTVICQAREIVEPSEINRDYIHTPHIFVDYILEEGNK